MNFLTNASVSNTNPGLKKEFDLYCKKYFEAFSADQKEFCFKKMSELAVILFEVETEDYVKEFKDSLLEVSREELLRRLEISYTQYSSSIIMSLKSAVYRQMLVIILEIKEFEKKEFNLYCEKYFDSTQEDKKEYYFKKISEIAAILFESENKDEIKENLSETDKEELQEKLKTLYKEYLSLNDFSSKFALYRQMLVIILELKKLEKKEQITYSKTYK